MKFIRRKIQVHVYTFANIDTVSGNAQNLHSVECGQPMTQTAIKAYCAEHGKCLCIDHSVREETYTLPVDMFIGACKMYAETAQEIEFTDEENDD